VPDPAGPCWQPVARPQVLRARADLLAAVRAFFAERQVMEVDTPVLSGAAVTHPSLASFSCGYRGPGGPRRLYLHTSPEFPMKRLLAAGVGSIYQICHVFRNGEFGRHHNPEFSLLEWYRVGFDHRQLMSEVDGLLGRVLPAGFLQAPARYLSYREAFQQYLDIDPLEAATGELIERARRLEASLPRGFGTDDRDAWLDWLFSAGVEPRLAARQVTFVHGYPATQAALARLDPDDPATARRFEVFVGGLELANGFHELRSADEQRRRFQAELRQRKAGGMPAVPLDEHLLAALAAGLPDCAGVALGFDRLLMLCTGATSLSEVLSFPLDRA
jgi:lysyl-tRNA synthetase class 2